MKSATILALSVCGSNPDYQNPKYITPIKNGVKSFRWWQIDAFKKLKNAQFGLVVAFCGSGKSIVMVGMAIHDIVQSGWKQKQLIIVPQSHIHRGFVGDEECDFISIEVEGKNYEWLMGDNFCSDQPGVLDALQKWLLTPGETLGRQFKGGNLVTGLTAVCTHQALGIVWERLTKAEKKQAIKNLSLRIDEAHHVNGVFDVNDGMDELDRIAMEKERTNLGNVCGYILNSGEKTVKLHLATATPYRGDNGIILSPKVAGRFQQYHLDWIDHFKTLGIEKFSLMYEEYSYDPIKSVVARIKAEPNEKHMVVIPSSGTKWRRNGTPELQALLTALHKVVPADRVLDLVTPATQDYNKQRLLREPKTAEKGQSRFDVVVTCMLGREGTDWCPCSRLHNTACESSITLAIQTIGRPFRRFTGKTEVNIIHYIPKFCKPKKGMTKAELLTDRTNALLVCMQMDEMFRPILIPVLKAAKTKTGEATEQKPSTLAVAFGSEYQKFKAELVEELESLQVKDHENLMDVVDDLVMKYGVKENLAGVKLAVEALVLRILSPAMKTLGVSVEFVREQGFGNLVKQYVSKDSSIFFGSYSQSDWTVLRTILRKEWQEQLVEYCKDIGNPIPKRLRHLA